MSCKTIPLAHMLKYFLSSKSTIEMKEHKIASLRQMCFKKLSYLYPSDEELAEFINHNRILKKIGMSVVREQMKYEKYSESSAKNVTSRDVTFCRADNQKRLFHEKAICFHELLDTVESCNCDSCVFVPSNCIPTSSNEERDGFSKSSEIKFSFLEGEADKYESKIIASSSSNAGLYDLNLSKEITGKAISFNLDTHGHKSDDEPIAIGRLIEMAKDLQVGEYSQTKLSTSFENSKDYFCKRIDLINIGDILNQTQKYPATNNLGENEKLRKVKNSENQKVYCEDFGSPNISELLKCEDSKIQKSSESVQGKCPTKEGMYLHVRETSEFQDDTIFADEEENFLKTEYHDVKMNCSSEETNKYDEIDDDSLLEILCSVFDSVCGTEEKQEYEQFESFGKSEDIHSEPYCVESAQILLHFLDKTKKNLQFMEDRIKLNKLNSEASVKELNSYDLEKIKDGKELQDIANNLVSSYDKISVDIEEDRAECERYSENFQSILTFFQEKMLYLQ